MKNMIHSSNRFDTHQESTKGHWHIPIASEQDSEEERVWLCVTRDTSSKASQECISAAKGKFLSSIFVLFIGQNKS